MTEKTNKVLRLADVIDMTGLSKSTIYTYIGNDKFPSKIQLGERAVGWRETEILDWIESRVSQKQNVGEGQNEL